MAIFVNVSRSTTASSTAEELLAATIGDWPFHGEQTIQSIAEFGDVIYGVRRNEIVSAYPIQAISLNDEHSRFVITPDPAADTTDISALVGSPLPEELAWRRGQQWPVKLYDSDDFAALIVQRSRTITLGGYTVELTDNGLEVHVPRGGAIVVRTSR